MIRSVVAVATGYVAFFVLTYSVWAAFGHGSEEVPQENLLMLSLLFETPFAVAAGYLTALVAGSREVRHSAGLAMASDPGWEYSYPNANFHLAAGVLTQATGMTPLAFARRYVFGPLRFADPIWDVDPQGIHWGFGGQMMLPSDLAKLGVVYLTGGGWHGRQVVSPGWVTLAGRYPHWVAS